MVPGLLLTSVATAVMSTALFTRRSRSGWLDELDGIRGDALAQPSGEVSMAMADAPALGDVERDTSPLTVLEAPLPPPATRPAVTVRPEPPAPAPASALAPSQPVAAAPLPRREPSQHSTASATSPPAPATAPPVGLRPPRLVAAEASASDQSSAPDEHGPVWVPPTVPATRPATRPAPHPVRPKEMWHPSVVAVPPRADAPPAAHEQIDPADLAGTDDDSETPSSRFRFARLRPVLSGPGPKRAGDQERCDAAEEADGDEDEVPYSLLDELLAPYGTPVEKEETGPVDHGSAPLVPAVSTGANRTLITGPVIRRTERDDEFIRRRDLQATLEADRLAGGGHRPAEEEGPSTEDAATETADDSSPVATDAAATDAADHVVPAEPDPEPAQVRRRLYVADDRSVALDGGHLRLADHAECEISGDADGVELQLLDGWCWAALGAVATTPAVVTLPVGHLTVPPGTTALAVVEADRTGFVVVVSGEALLEHAGGRARLRPGAMVLIPVGCPPRVDVASRDEIESDPLVSRNMDLDAQR